MPKKGGGDPEVVKGQKIVVGSCISCHHLGNAGGNAASPSFVEVAGRAVSSKDYFRKVVTDPRSVNPIATSMPTHPTFDDETFNALEAYFKAMMPIERSRATRRQYLERRSMLAAYAICVRSYLVMRNLYAACQPLRCG